MDLLNPPAPLSARERMILWAVGLACAVSRFAAIARSLWDWDEVLFCLGMRSYDITRHHPHPPGFPVFIGLGRLVRVFVRDDFRSLQTINVIAAVLLFPAVFMLARELRLRFTTSVIAAALCAFFPNVWFYGGTAFSDIPSITLVVFAAAFLFRGCRDAEVYLVGVFLLALAIGIRPQNALVGLFPLILASTRRSARDIAFGALIGGLTIVTAFGGAIAATGSYDAFMGAIRSHGEYITQVDSFRSPARPPLWRLAALFFAKQYSWPPLGNVTTLFVLISIVGAIRNRDRSMLYNALTFGPFAIAAWLMLDRYSVNRFSIGYCPMFAIFAVDGIHRLAPRVEAALGTILIAGFGIYTLPALTAVRRDVAPSVLAVEAARTHFDAKRDDLFVASDMVPFVDYFMPPTPYVRVLDERAMILSAGSRVPRLIAEIVATSPEGFVFRREHGRLWNIGRRHYFGAAYATITKLPQFVSGWYPPERIGEDEWRWTASQSTTLLPPEYGETLLRLGFTARGQKTITIQLNGKQIDRFEVSDGYTQREWHVTPAPNGAPNTLAIATDGDRRIRVRYLSWALY